MDCFQVNTIYESVVHADYSKLNTTWDQLSQELLYIIKRSLLRLIMEQVEMKKKLLL